MDIWVLYVFIVLICVIFLLTLYTIRLRRKSEYIEKNLAGYGKHNQQLKKTILHLEHMIRQYEYFNTALEIFKLEKAVKILKNGNDELYIVMEAYRNNSIDFYFSGYSHKGICGCPRLLATIKDDYIWIDDLFAIDENYGNGTLLLSCLFEKAKELKIGTIRGELSPRDADKFTKLEHFYRKNGFNVYFNSSRSKGEIEKEIHF